MANEWLVPTSLHYLKNALRTWTDEFKGRTLSTELGFAVNPVYDRAGEDQDRGLLDWSAHGWQRPFFDDFNTNTPVGQVPPNVIDEMATHANQTPVERWWVYGRAPTGSGGQALIGFTRPDFSTPQYQQLAPSILGMGAVRLPTVTIGGTTYNGIFLSGNMQTERRSPTKIAPEDGSWSRAQNLAYSQAWGYVETRYKAPRFEGSWPGFWAVSDDEYTAGMFPRIEEDYAETYLTGTAEASSERGVVHNVTWLHRTQQAAWIAPGWTLYDKGFSSFGAPGIDNTHHYPDGTMKNWDDGFHSFGRYMKKDPTAPNGIGWLIYYVDRIESCRIPMIAEWQRYYYHILSTQTQSPYQQNMVPYEQHWMEIDYVASWRNPLVTDPPRIVPYVPPVLTDPIKTVSIARLERALSIKSDCTVNGAILQPEHSNPNTPPQMAQSARFIMIAGTTAGAAVGTVAVTNSPTNPVKYRLSGTGASDFVINQSTGAIVVAPGKTLAINLYDLKVGAWDSPITPCILGSNVTKVLVDVRADATFGFEYWNRGAVPKLRAWIDAQDTASFDVGAGSKVTQIRDKGVAQGLVWSQTDDTKLPVLTSSAIGGFAAWESVDSTVRMDSQSVITSSAFTNIVTRGSGALGVGAGALTPNGVYDFVNPCILFMAWKADPAVNPDPIICSVNGTDQVATGSSPANKSYTVAVACVFKADSAGGSGQNLGSIINGSMLFTDGIATPRWFDGKLGEFGLLYWPANEGITTLEHQKLVGGLAHKWGLTSLLPGGHPYKTVVPKLWA